jgi:hypothetical protein
MMQFTEYKHLSKFRFGGRMLRRPAEFWLGLYTLLFVAATAAIAYLHPFPQGEKRIDPIALRVRDQDGRMRIDWDANNELVRKAQGATLEVDDGGVMNRYPVEPKTLRAGGFDYIRKTPEVLLTLTLFHDGKPGALATVRSIGPIQAAAPPPPDPTPRRRDQSRGRRRR